MNQLYEKKCDCQPYDDDHRSTLIKMELPEYEESQLKSLSHSISSTIRIAVYLLIFVLLGYSLWRIHEMEIALNASDRYVNITRLLESNNLNHIRHARSIDINNFDPNGLGFDEKELPVKNENLPAYLKRPMTKDEFVHLTNTLFDKIQYMHNDGDRSHFDNNMKAVFKAWFPVFDALLPRDMMENPDAGRTRAKRSVDKTSEESSEEKKPVRVTRSAKVSSEESDEKKDKPNEKKKSSEESSEEKKTVRITRSVEQNSEESTEISNNHSNQENSVEKISEESVEEKDIEENKNNFAVSKITDISEEKNEEASDEEHERRNRSIDSSSSESSESVEKKNKSIYKKYIDEYSKMRNGKYLKKYSQESSESSESVESKEKKFNKFNDNNKYVYVVSDNQANNAY